MSVESREIGSQSLPRNRDIQSCPMDPASIPCVKIILDKWFDLSNNSN